MNCPECGKNHRTYKGAEHCYILRQNIASHVAIATIAAGGRPPTALEETFLKEFKAMETYFQSKGW